MIEQMVDLKTKPNTNGEFSFVITHFISVIQFTVFYGFVHFNETNFFRIGQLELFTHEKF